jgi:hypothetical protein
LTNSYSSTHTAVLVGYRILYDDVTRKFTVKTTYDYVDAGLDPVLLSLVITKGTDTYACSNDTGNQLFETDINRSDVEDGLTNLIFSLSYNGGIIKKYKTSLTFIQDLGKIVSSVIEDHGGGNIDAYDVPLVEQSFYIVNQNWLDINVLQKMSAFAQDIVNYRMLTDQVYLKFANTWGKIKNIEYNALNPSAVKTYVNPDYYIPIAISLKVYIKQENAINQDALINTIRATVYNYYNATNGDTKFGFEVNIYQSEISKVVSGITGVEFCEVTSPDDSIVYDYRREDLSKQQMIEFTPEYLWFRPDDIEIEIIID